MHNSDENIVYLINLCNGLGFVKSHDHSSHEMVRHIVEDSNCKRRRIFKFDVHFFFDLDLKTTWQCYVMMHRSI